MPLSTAPIITRDSVFDALALARRCFDETEDVTEASRALFYRATEFSSFFGRMLAGELKLWGCADGELRAVGALRGGRDIVFLYVAESYRGFGLDAALVEAMREEVLTHGGTVLTASPSPSEAHVYERLGFRPAGVEQTRGGAVFVPLELPLDGGFDTL